MLNKRKLKILCNRYAKAIGMDKKVVWRVFDRGDVHQKKRDIIAMRATLYARRVLPKDATPEQQLEAIAEYAKKEDLRDAKFPEFNKKNGSVDGSGSQENS